MMIYELDDIEKDVLMRTVVTRARADLNNGKALTQARTRPGEKIQTWWCDGCETWHEGSVLGGPIGDPHGEANNA